MYLFICLFICIYLFIYLFIYLSTKDWKDSYYFLLYEARKAHHKVLVSENKENPKALFKIVKGLLNMSNKQPVMPCNVDSTGVLVGGGGRLPPKIKLNHGLFSIPYKWFINIRDIAWFSIKCVFLPFCCKLPHSQIIRQRICFLL